MKHEYTEGVIGNAPCILEDGQPKKIEDIIAKLNQTPDDDQKPVGLCGWVCPACGRGNSPYSSHCTCIPLPPPVVTFGFEPNQ